MKHNSSRSRRRQIGGSIIFVVVALMILVLPTLLFFVRSGNYQNRRALRDRNMKTAREMAESVNVDFMNSFSDDWHRDYFNPLYTDHDISGFAGLGSANASLGVFRSSAVITLTTQATYDKGLASFSLKERKTLRSSYFWSSDALKFDYVFPGDVVIGGNVDRLFLGLVDAIAVNNTFYVNGNFNSGTTTATIRGMWVVKNTFTRQNPVQLIDATIHCGISNPVGSPPAMVSSNLRTFPDASLMVPNVKIIGPEGADLSGSLGHYKLALSVLPYAITPGNALRLRLDPTNYTTTDLDTDLNDIPFSTNSIAYTTVSTVPWVFGVTGGDVYLDGGSIGRPTTVVVFDGDVHVMRDITYNGAPNAMIDRSFALLTEQNLYIENPGLGLVQTLVGFYGAPSGRIMVQGNIRNINVTGTLYGFIGVYSIGSATRGLNVSADPGLSQFPPPLFPRRPRLLKWRYPV